MLHCIELPRSGHACWAKSQPAARYLAGISLFDGGGTSHVIWNSLLATRRKIFSKQLTHYQEIL